jgi:hypothetical protein
MLKTICIAVQSAYKKFEIILALLSKHIIPVYFLFKVRAIFANKIRIACVNTVVVAVVVVYFFVVKNAYQ